MSALTTFVVWVVCAATCVVGMTVRPERFRAPELPAPPPAPRVELIKVALSNEVIADAASSVDSTENHIPLPLPAPTPPTATTTPLPEAPALIPVAAPATVAFALPVEAPSQIVAVEQAAYAAPVIKTPPPEAVPARPAAVAVVARRLTFGQGEGRQPAPRYPDYARRHNQTGTVRVRFTVGEDGRVADALAIQPCDWSLLNEAAADTVLRRWRFPKGPRRIYEVDIRFELHE